MSKHTTTQSAAMFARAQQTIAGGVGSIARSPLAGFAPYPPFIERGDGSRLWDVDGNEYIDYALGFGPLLLGHCPPQLTSAVVSAISNRGTIFAMSHDLEYEAAEKVVAHLPAVDMVRFCNSGTEAVMAAIRLARGYTGKDKIVRFEGHYHGWSDIIHWNVRSPLGAIGLRHNPRPVPGTAGIPAAYGQSLIIQPWNDPQTLEKTVKRHAHEIAAIITEPIMCNLGATEPQEGYLAFLRQLCDEHDILLIFDEVITAFRLGLGGAQAHYGVMPDLTTIAKALGGGYPVAALGGRREVMALMARHEVSHAGTYNQNVLAMAAVKATIAILEQPGVYEHLYALSARLAQGLQAVSREAGLPAVVQGVGPALQVWFEEEAIVDYRDAMRRGSFGLHARFRDAMYRRGVLFNGQVGVWYLSTAHSAEDIDATLEAAREALRQAKG